MEIDVFDLVRVPHGRIVEHRGVPDRLGALLRLRLVGARPGRARPPLSSYR